MFAEFLSEHVPQLAGLAALLTASAFFSGTETAMFRLTRGQLHHFSLSQNTLERLVASLMARPRRLLNTLLLGNMLVNVAFASVSAVMVLGLRARGAPAWGLAAASAAPLLAVILLGEVTPKMLASSIPQRWAKVAAIPIHTIRRILAPIVLVIDRLLVGPLVRILAPRRTGEANVSAEELAALLDLSAKRGLLDLDANALLQEIVSLAQLRVGDIMVPRVDMIAWDVDSPAAGLVELFARTRLRRIPVYEGDVDHVLGVVRARRVLLEPGAPLRSLVEPVPFVPEAGSAEKLLVELRTARRQTAIVVDEYGGTAGLVTLHDVVEEIVGDIPDPHEAPAGPAVQQIAPTQYRLDGDLAIHEWDDAFHLGLARLRVSTVGGFVTSLLGRIPRAGDEADYRNLHFTVEDMRGRRIGKIRLELREEGQ